MYTARYTGHCFEQETVELAENRFYSYCAFTNCRLVYKGGPIRLQGCSFIGCNFALECSEDEAVYFDSWYVQQRILDPRTAVVRGIKAPMDRANIVRVFASLMGEIRARAYESQKLLNLAVKKEVHPRMAIEFGHLSIRLTCEVIGLACLLAQHDIPGARAKVLNRNYQPRQIFRGLEKLKPGAYPQPCEVTLGDDGIPMPGSVPIEKEYLTRDELERLWDRTGDYLHRGRALQFYKERTPPVTKGHFNEIAAWHRKIKGLLDVCKIDLAVPHSELCVVMVSPEDRDKVWVGLTYNADRPELGWAFQCTYPEVEPDSSPVVDA